MKSAVRGALAALATTFVLAPLTPHAVGQDPWPMWQRTPTRLGHTTARGPRTPTIAWSVQVEANAPFVILSGSAIMDATGRVFVPHRTGVTAVDGGTGELLWMFQISDAAGHTPALHDGKILFGSPNDLFYCVDAATGQEIWSVAALPHPNMSPVVDANGVVYYPSTISSGGPLYARRVDDGTLLWSVDVSGSVAAPALDGMGQVFTGSPVLFDWSAHRTSDGQPLWSFIMAGWNQGTAPVVVDAGENGRVYTASSGGFLYALDRLTGQKIWSYRSGQTVSGAVAVGHDGTIYLATSCCDHVLIAVSPDGEELWRYEIGLQTKFAPIVDGDGIINQTAFRSPATGQVHAIRPDGTALWVKEMPERCAASPMLAPDGTLYVVCSDKRLYAFKDPPPQTGPPGAAVTPKSIRRVPPP